METVVCASMATMLGNARLNKDFAMGWSSRTLTVTGSGVRALAASFFTGLKFHRQSTILDVHPLLVILNFFS